MYIGWLGAGAAAGAEQQQPAVHLDATCAQRVFCATHPPSCALCCPLSCRAVLHVRAIAELAEVDDGALLEDMLSRITLPPLQAAGGAGQGAPKRAAGQGGAGAEV